MTTIARGALTAHLLTALNAASLLVGDGKAPDAGGWDDDPNSPNSNYVPYIVILPQTAQAGQGSIGDPTSEWQVPYIITSYGVGRDQVEWQADKARIAFTSTAEDHVPMGSESWKITQTWVNSIGGIARNDNMEPSEFSQIDLVSLRISKEM